MSLPKPYYQTDLGILYHGDCLDILPLLDPVDLVLTDPPYNLGFKYDVYDDEPKEWNKFFEPIFSQLRLKARTVLISTGITNLYQYSKIEPWKWLLAWYKPAAMGRSPVGFNNFEPIAMWGDGCRNGTDVIRAPIISSKLLSGHPCPKPLTWATGILNLFKDHKIILDPFIGSGTTAVACERLNLEWIGIEISEQYCEMAAKRIEKEREQLKLFPQFEPEQTKLKQASIF